MKHTLLILDDWDGRISANPCWENVKEFVDIVTTQEPIAALTAEALNKVDVLLAIRERTALTSGTLSRLPNLKLILQTGGHAYHIDTKYAASQKIPIALGRQAKAPLASVPELTLAMMLGLMHLLPQAQTAMRAGEWPLLLGRSLAGKRLGILGMGRHGSRVADIASNGFNMEVMAWERPAAQTPQPHHFPRLPLDALLATSDVVSIHLRLSDDSRGLMDAAQLSTMKKGAFLINTSRGAIVNEPALINALETGMLAGAGLDVFAQEPLAVDSPLRSFPNVMLTPHIGWTVEEVFDEFASIACMQLEAYLHGTLPPSAFLLPV